MRCEKPAYGLYGLGLGVKIAQGPIGTSMLFTELFRQSSGNGIV